MSLGSDGLPEDGLEFGGLGPAGVAEVDLVVVPGHPQVVGGEVLVMEPGEYGSFVIVGSEVQELGARALMQGLAADVGDRGEALLRQRGLSGLVDEVVGDPVG